MDFRLFNLNVDQQRHVIVWLSGLSGLLLGIISMLIMELRVGIDSWIQLFLVLVGIGAFVIVCNTLVTRFFQNKQKHRGIGKIFWLLIIVGHFSLIVITVTLALKI
jgi:hypothetical protein